MMTVPESQHCAGVLFTVPVSVLFAELTTVEVLCILYTQVYLIGTITTGQIKGLHFGLPMLYITEGNSSL